MKRARWRNARDATSVEAAVTTAAYTEADGEATEAAVVVAAGDSARRERPKGPNVGGYRYEASQARASTRGRNKNTTTRSAGRCVFIHIQDRHPRHYHAYCVHEVRTAFRMGDRYLRGHVPPVVGLRHIRFCRRSASPHSRAHRPSRHRCRRGTLAPRAFM